MNRVDNAGSSTGEPTVNSLRILQVGIHSRGGVNKPRTKMSCCQLCVTRILSELPCCDKRRNLHTEAHQVASMISKVIGIRHAIALDIRRNRVLRIGPPVVTFGKEIVQTARTAW